MAHDESTPIFSSKFNHESLAEFGAKNFRFIREPLKKVARSWLHPVVVEGFQHQSAYTFRGGEAQDGGYHGAIRMSPKGRALNPEGIQKSQCLGGGAIVEVGCKIIELAQVS